MIQTVKYQANIETPTEYTGYLVNGTMNVPLDPANGHYQMVQPWIFDGNTPEPAYTQEELDEYEHRQDQQILKSMNKNGTTLFADNTTRYEVEANPIIEDEDAFAQWMKAVYDEIDAEGTALHKPPPTERQKMRISLEDADRYTFTRYQDEWGWRWYLRLYRDTVNALGLAIYDANGNYLYNTGALLQHPDGGWYTECPAGQADATVEDVYYKWLLGSADISGLQVYKASEEEKSGVVRSDERYDIIQ